MGRVSASVQVLDSSQNLTSKDLGLLGHLVQLLAASCKDSELLFLRTLTSVTPNEWFRTHSLGKLFVVKQFY